jgi:choice-of-anchor A domain-containing protein
MEILGCTLSGMVARAASMAATLVLFVAFAGPALADWGLPSYTVFGTQSVTINDGLNETTTCITGNVGTGGTAAGARSLDKCLVNGNVAVTTASVLNLGSHGAYSGSLITGSLASVGSTMSTVSGNLAGLMPNLTFASLSNMNETFTNTSTTGGTYVIDITGSASTTNPYTWAFAAANANDKFVVNIGGDVALAQLQISLMGITADQLIFNLTGASCSSCTAEVNKSDSVWFGTILAPDYDVRVHNPFPFTGDVFGNTVTVDSGGILNGTSAVPEPKYISLLCVGMAGILVIRRRRSS